MALSFVTFGEVMGRMSPRGNLRFAQSLPGEVEWTFGGGEVNVAASLAAFGADTTFVTALPRNPLADACVRYLRSLGVDTSRIVRTEDGRLGLYFLEKGADQRPSVVTYDRAGSSVMLAPSEAYNWHSILSRAGWFHVTGITPALSHSAAESALAGMREAKAAGAVVSFDLNFRKTLWKWHTGLKGRDLAERTIRGLLAHADIVIGNEEDADLVLGIRAEGTDVERGRLRADAYADVARQMVRQFPHVRQVGITLRESVSASHNNWGGMLYDSQTDQAVFAPLDSDGLYCPYQIRHIVDRVGGGDAFAAGLIFALSTPELTEASRAVSFAAAASCLKHSIQGDLNLVSRAEVEALMKGHSSGRVKR